MSLETKELNQSRQQMFCYILSFAVLLCVYGKWLKLNSILVLQQKIKNGIQKKKKKGIDGIKANKACVLNQLIDTEWF